jgi:RNA polymerase sigma factor (sigma-70 family)
MTALSERRRLAEFIQTEYRRLLGFVRRRLDEIEGQDAEDFVHDVVVQLFDRTDMVAPIEHLSAYVYRSLQNRIVDYFRKRKNTPARSVMEPEQELQSLSEVVEESGYDSAPEIRRMEIAHDLYRLMGELSDPERRLIVESDIHGQTIEHLSKTWGVPVNTLLSRKSRALKKIRQQIQNGQTNKE